VTYPSKPQKIIDVPIHEPVPNTVPHPAPEPTREPANPVILRIDQAAGFLRCRFQWCGQYSREFIVPL
jgi:hypothetical protein